MIRNIIFDMGGVLRVWDPEEFMEAMKIPEDDRKILMREIFGAVEWPMQDLGLITEEETLERVRARIPERLRGGQLVFGILPALDEFLAGDAVQGKGKRRQLALGKGGGNPLVGILYSLALYNALRLRLQGKRQGQNGDYISNSFHIGKV